MTDVVIASLPFVETKEPLMAPALLKAVTLSAGLESTTIDLNIEIIKKIESYPKVLQEKVQRWFLYEENKTDQDTIDKVNQLVVYACDRILENFPRYICLSLFCNTAKQFNVLLCKLLKKTYPEGVIIIGGNAVFTDEKSQRPYAKIIQRARLIDHYIVGDGEESLYKLLTGKSSSGVDVDKFQILEDLDKQPFSNYDDYDWSLYEKKRLPMYASRGCVRRCTFCDVYKLWTKFKLRDSAVVFDEMLYQIKKTGITDFYFRDSLINGSISEYRKLMGLIAEYNKSAQRPISWTSFFIFRPQTQMSEEDWALTAAGGADELVIGVESLVDSIRYHMRKKFTNADILYGLEMAKKYKINLVLLLIIGYVNETQKDFEDAMQWLEDHKQFAHYPIKSISVGGTLTVTDLTDLYQQAQDFDITIGPKIHLWENKKIGLDYATREKRKALFINRALELGYPISSHEKPVT